MKKKTKSPLAVKLVRTRIAKLNFQALKPPIAEAVSIEVSLAGGFGYNAKEKQLSVAIAVGISGKNSPFKIEMEFEGLFLLNRKATKKEVEPFAEINCNAILFPYVRETIAEITRRAGYAPLHLASINFVGLFKQPKKGSSRKKKTQN